MKGARFPCVFCNSHETSLGLHSVQREFRVKAADYGEGPSLMQDGVGLPVVVGSLQGTTGSGS